MRAMTVPTV